MADENDDMCAWKLQGGNIPRWVKKHLPKKPERVVKKPDRRRKVSLHNIQNGGRFRSVVKVFTVIGNRMYQGTGWLIRDNLVVTAGHLVVHVPSKRRNKQTFATIVRVYIGYSGKDTMASEDVDLRQGTMVAVPRNYATKKKSVNDFAFVQLDQPFRNVKPIPPRVTPGSGDTKLCVVGYPGDQKKVHLAGVEEEEGAEMYSERTRVIWNLEDQ